MPCNSDHLESTVLECEMTKVVQLMDEITKGIQPGRNYGDGYDKRVYCQNLTKAKRDDLVESLCSLCQTIDVTKQSLELQLWWRDHQKVDKEKMKQLKQKQEDEKLRKLALKKLTKKEQRLLGLI